MASGVAGAGGLSQPWRGFAGEAFSREFPSGTALQFASALCQTLLLFVQQSENCVQASGGVSTRPFKGIYMSARAAKSRLIVLENGDGGAHGGQAVSYTHLTLPTKRIG